MNLPPPPAPESFGFWTEEKVRVSDTDLNGHVNPAAVAAFFESGRAELMAEAAGPPAESRFGPALVRMVIEYRREIAYPARLRVGSAVSAIGTTSVTVGQALFQGAECVATAESVFMLIDLSTRRPLLLEDTLRARFMALAPSRNAG